ncbi:MAG: hypothetical protein EXQ47_01465 [Bryobacterales bacterium]|nr:hypothetical protein [Bryobacterales bacterium]
MSVLAALAKCKGEFGKAAARQTAALLERVRRMRIRDPEELIELHETVLFLRAHPQSARVLKLADQILFSFSGRVGGLDQEPFEYSDVSGIAGTGLGTTFSYPFAKSLAERHGGAIHIDWDHYQHADKLGPILGRLIPEAFADWAVAPHPDWRRWYEQAGGNLGWLISRVRPDVYDLLDLPLRWELSDSSVSRSHARIACKKIFYHSGPFLTRNNVSFTAEFAAPKITATRLPRQQAQAILDIIIDASAVRYRELYGFLYPDLAGVFHADLGRGVAFYFLGIPRKWRLPRREYYAGMYFKNGVPTGYVEVISSREEGGVRMEVGFNLYYTFRQGETAWLYARLLKLFRERYGVTTFAIDPYQIGHQNDEAIESGAFWFYYKLGFRPESPEIAALAEREERKLATRPGYRSSPATLRKLAAGSMAYNCG